MHFKIAAILMFILLSNPTYAYIDPGTGSMFLQTFLAILAMIGGGISVFWKYLKNLFVKPSKAKENKDSAGLGNQCD